MHRDVVFIIGVPKGRTKPPKTAEDHWLEAGAYDFDETPESPKS
jgi:hypothetical protein